MSTTEGPRADVLVVHASKAGGTAGIAALIANELRAQGLSVHVAPATDVDHLAGYRSVVLGSALYMRRWRPEAVRFLRRHAVMLRGRPVWLFQSGPCGPDAAEQAEAGVPEPANVRRLREGVDAEAPITFGGVLDPASARGFVAKRMARGGLAGDFRDPERIRRWARSIAEEIRPAEPSGRSEVLPVG
ncbi:MAG: flavodoxin [Pseudonocardia sp.]|jgi:menaquinone-dependent protoporphyrinogen oxidase|uniref:flavodoxin domain-containing protein n=1 Tax=Pseudonocardia sp. TaxID=60912 RepID=UPI0026132B67|nr:flavodoxin domain-containing protein [Pseudonocardia sp.]MCU1631205.1 flavodoxin [Pseudonocardia sp.]